MKWTLIVMVFVVVVGTFTLAAFDFEHAKSISYMLVLVVGFVLGAGVVMGTNHQHNSAEQKRFMANMQENAGLMQSQFRNMSSALTAQQHESKALQQQFRALKEANGAMMLPAPVEQIDNDYDESMWDMLEP